ncbi:MAG: DUF1223 domain-containing protein [Paracoccus hibiscisoli]|uniref:DUF1223 domain-containing protein n=1 Tax=Paracoccus hibiscisoli TaxID=2023261 RepID=UPI003919DCBF
MKHDLTPLTALTPRFAPRTLIGALVTALLLAGGPALAQTADAVGARSGMSATAAPPSDGGVQSRGGFEQSGQDAPLILAPDDPGRQSPASMLAPGLPMTEAGGINGFAAMEAAPPVSADLPGAGVPVVVELFTSQGCSNCPPADAMLTMLAGQGDVLALSYHVDYWDYLGWADSFARPEFTDRQTAYAHAAGERSVYTPQMIVEGQDTSVSPGPAQLMGLIDQHRFAPAMVSIRRDRTERGEAIEVQPLSDLGGAIDVVLIRYAPERRVDVRAGENRGRSVVYSNVVLGLEHLSRWDGQQPLRLTVRAELVEGGAYPPDTRHAVLIQQMQGKRALPGPILAAIRLD